MNFKCGGSTGQDSANHGAAFLTDTRIELTQALGESPERHTISRRSFLGAISLGLAAIAAKFRPTPKPIRIINGPLAEIRIPTDEELQIYRATVKTQFGEVTYSPHPLYYGDFYGRLLFGPNS